MASCIFQTVLFALAGIPYYQVLADARSRRYQISPGSHSKELPSFSKAFLKAYSFGLQWRPQEEPAIQYSRAGSRVYFLLNIEDERPIIRMKLEISKAIGAVPFYTFAIHTRFYVFRK